MRNLNLQISGSCQDRILMNHKTFDGKQKFQIYLKM